MRPLLFALMLGVVLNAPAICRGESPGQPAQASEVRNWTDATGRFHMVGTLLGADRSQVRLQKVHGAVITVPIARLSLGDQRFVSNSLKSPSASVDRLAPGAAGKSRPENSGSTQAVSSSASTEWLDKLTAGWSSVAGSSSEDAGAVAGVGRLMLQPAPPMPENMVYVRLSRKFLERTAQRDIDERAAVNDTILGHNVVGVSRTVGSTNFEWRPSDDYGLAEIHFVGTSTYNTVADGGPVHVLIRGVTRFASAKALRFDGQGIHLGPAATNARTSSTITGIETSLPGLRGRIASRIGGRRAEADRADAEAITAEHTQRRINQGFDASASREIADLWKIVGEQIASLPADDPLRQCGCHVSSTQDALQIVLLAPPGDKDGRVPAPSPMLADAEIEVQFHVALVRKAMTDVRLQRLLQPVAVRLASLSPSMPAGRSQMCWSRDHNWLSLSWRSGDRPTEPVRPENAVLASQGQ